MMKISNLFKYHLIAFLVMITGVALAQKPIQSLGNTNNVVRVNGELKVVDSVTFGNYPNTDPNKVLSLDSTGKLKLITPIGGGGGGVDSAIVKVIVKDTANLLRLSIITGSVATISALTSYVRGNVNVVTVTDPDRGGTFSWAATGTANGGTVFAATGGGYWVRQTSQSQAINAKWFGSLGDGTDQQSTINAALTFIGSQKGGTLYFPNGVYGISQAIQTSSSKTYLTGEKGAVIKMLDPTKLGILIVNDSCEVSGLTIYGTGTTSADIVLGTTISLQGANFCTIKDNTIKHSGSNGISVLAGSSNNLIANNIMSEFVGTIIDNSGILINYATAIQTSNNIFTKNKINGTSKLGKGIMLLGVGENNSMTDNIISNCAAYGIVVYQTSHIGDSLLQKTNIVNNTITNIGDTAGTDFGAGIYINQSYNSIATNNHVTNVCIGTSDTTHLAMGGISTVSVGGTTISDNFIDSTNGWPGVNVGSVFGGTVSGNHIYNSSIGVNITNASNISVTKNLIQNIDGIGVSIAADTASSGGRPALYMGKVTGQSMEVSNNDITCFGYGIQVTGQTYDTISFSHFDNNVILNNTGLTPLYFSYLRNSSISNNKCNSIGSTNGIRLNGDSHCVDNIVNDNILKSTVPFDVGLLITGTATISNNTISSAGYAMYNNGTYYPYNTNIIQKSILGITEDAGDNTDRGASTKFVNNAISDSALIRQPLEDQRLSTSNTVGFQKLSITGSSASDLGELDITNTNAGGNNWRIGDGVATSSGRFSFYNTTHATIPFYFDYLNLYTTGSIVGKTETQAEYSDKMASTKWARDALVDSLTALNIRYVSFLAQKTDTSFRDTTHVTSPLEYDTTTHTLRINADTLAKWNGSAGGSEFGLDLTNQSTDQTFSAVALSHTGLYRVTVFISITTAATTSSTLPAITISWVNGDSGATQTVTPIASQTTNTTATHGQITYDVYVASGGFIQVSAAGYASSGATAMKYSIHQKNERL